MTWTEAQRKKWGVWPDGVKGERHIIYTSLQFILFLLKSLFQWINGKSTNIGEQHIWVCTINKATWIVLKAEIPPDFCGKVEFVMDCDF